LQSSGGKVHIRRTLVATTIAITTLLGTTACNLTSPVASLDYYAPSDGAQVDLGALKARNLMYLVALDEKNQAHYGLVGSFANSSATEMTVTLKLKTTSGEVMFRQFPVGPYKVKSFGFEGQSALKTDLQVSTAVPATDLAENPALIGGSAVSILIYTDSDQAELSVPVMAKTDNVSTYDDLFAQIATN
jgi:hypothetical protein